MLLLSLCACGNDEQVVALEAEYSTQEETPLTGVLPASGVPDQYAIMALPRNGTIALSPQSGEFVYEPDRDFYGVDEFRFSVRNGRAWSKPATIVVNVENVNDPPAIEPIEDARNSPDDEYVEVLVRASDPDSEIPVLSVTVADPDIVEASIDQNGRLLLKALRIGETTVTVNADDGEYRVSTDFSFVSEEVVKTLWLEADPNGGVIELENRSDATVSFWLSHNDFQAFTSLEDIVAYVEQMPEQTPGEGFERKLWRFVDDWAYHDAPLSGADWLHDPWVTLNLGWGFCSHVAALFAEVARAAGYEARVWGLNGHVVPEIRVNDEWRMYDPDLGVYYRTEDGRIAGVEELASRPSLITDPIDPVHPRPSPYSLFSAEPDPHSPVIANLYSSVEDNVHYPSLWPRIEPFSPVELPAGARLTYPGKWTEAPVGHEDETIEHYRQALLSLPPGWVGTLSLPWVIWDIRGAGQVGIDGMLYDVGSPELTERIRRTNRVYQPIRTIEVFSNAELEIVFFVNAVKFDVRPLNRIELRGVAVWAVTGETSTLEPMYRVQ